MAFPVDFEEADSVAVTPPWIPEGYYGGGLIVSREKYEKHVSDGTVHMLYGEPPQWWVDRQQK